MKKFWNLMLAALVIIGAAACTENYEGVDVAESLSFYAEIGNDDTRAYIADTDGDKTWNTVFEGTETLYVNEYPFTNTTEEPGKFTCTAAGVSKLAGQTVTIKTDGKHYSRQGKAAFNATATVENFTADKVKLQAHTSFFRFTYNGEGEVKISLGDNAFRNDDFSETNEITLKGVRGEAFLAFWPGLEGLTTTLTFSVNGEVVKQKEVKLAAGKVYNLGDMSPTYKIYVHKFNNTWNTVNLYSWCTIGGEEYHPTNAWPGAATTVTENINGYNYMVWTMPAEVNGASIQLILNNGEGTQTADCKLGTLNKDYYLVLKGSEIIVLDNCMPEFSVGVVGLGGNWDVDADMTLDGDYYTLKNVSIAETDTFKVRISDSWMENYGVEKTSEEESVGIECDKMYNVVLEGANMSVAAGTYDLYFNYENKEFYVLTVGKTPEDLLDPAPETINIGLVGSFQTTAWNEKAPVEMTYAGHRWIVAKGIELYKDDEFKFVQDKAWTVSYGGQSVFVANVDQEYQLVSSYSQNIKAAKNGKFNIYFHLDNHKFKYECVEEYADFTVDITIANKANWSPLYITLKSGNTTIANQTTVTNNKYAISGDYIGESLSYVLSNGSKTMEGDVYITKHGATVTLEEIVVSKKLYLKPNSNWTKDGARFAAYFFGNGEKWVSMTAVSGTEYYEVTVPDGYPNVIFCRMNGGASANNWNNKWNQTSDLTIPTNDNNLYTVKTGTWDKGGGTWSVVKL